MALLRHKKLLKAICLLPVFSASFGVAIAASGPPVEVIMQGGDANINMFTNTPSFPTGMEINGAFYNSYGTATFNSFVPNNLIDGSSVTKQGNTFNGANQLLQLSNTGIVPNSLLNGSSVTLQGNTFNGANQLLQLNGSGAVSSLTISSLTVSNTKLLIAGFQSFPILQIQSFTTSVPTTNSIGVVFGTVNSDLSVSITPHFATSKIFVWVYGTQTCAPGASCYTSILRNGTNLGNGNGGLAAFPSNSVGGVSMIAYDSPSVTSAVTYTVGLRVDGGGSQAFPTNSFATEPLSGIFAVEIAQ